MREGTAFLVLGPSVGRRFGGRYESGDYESGLRALLWHFLIPHGGVAFVLPNTKIHGTLVANFNNDQFISIPPTNRALTEPYLV